MGRSGDGDDDDCDDDADVRPVDVEDALLGDALALRLKLGVVLPFACLMGGANMPPAIPVPALVPLFGLLLDLLSDRLEAVRGRPGWSMFVSFILRR